MKLCVGARSRLTEGRPAVKEGLDASKPGGRVVADGTIEVGCRAVVEKVKD
jgi:hypothetical protein